MKNFKIIFGAALALAFMCGCQSTKVEISGRFVGNDSKKVYLEQVLPLNRTIIDSVELDKEGGYEFLVENAPKTPMLYNLVYQGDKIPMLLQGGDDVKIEAVGNVIHNYTVKGSEETLLLKDFYQTFVKGMQELDDISSQFTSTQLNETKRKELVKKYNEASIRIRQEQVQFIVRNKSSVAAVYALYQRLPGHTFLFNGENDVIYYRTVAEALERTYPQSPYLQSLLAEVARFDASISLASNIVESQYPDLTLRNAYGKKMKLSSLAGKVILLDFWSAELGNSNQINADMKEIYEQYHEAKTPFEIYQVGVDTSKALWIQTIQEQELPWISVSDFMGEASPALRVYNITKLPANFLIDREGKIVAKNIYGKELQAKLHELTR